MQQLPTIPREIGPSVLPTFKTYEPLLRANANAIKSTKFETFTYGNHPRQTLDVYYPSQKRRPSVLSSNNPVLIFLHGGGLVNGSKTLPLADGLAHANVGHFFAERLGYTTVIPDYRLMSHGARFPSGGEDLAQVMDWIKETMTKHDGYQNIDVFIMGNSAGGIHMSTYLFAPDFATSRARFMTSDLEQAVRLRGVVFLSTPFNFRKSDASRDEVLAAYYGSPEEIEERSPHGLLKTAMLQDPDNVLINVKAMILDGSLDSNDEILIPKKQLLHDWDELDPDSREALIIEVMEGHNHISPPLALGTDIEAEEAWGYQVGGFLNSIRG